MNSNENVAQVPDEIWDNNDLTYIHSSILFADFGSSEFAASVLSPRKYDELINDFQLVIRDEIKELKRENFPIAETRVFGDELCLLFYDPSEVEDNFQLDMGGDLSTETKRKLIAERGRKNEELVYSAMLAAIRLKNAWLVSDANISRLKEHIPPLDLSIGLNYGWTYFGKRSEGTQRVEGYPISAAKHIMGRASHGRTSRILASQLFHNTLRQSNRKHTQLKQRVFFGQFPMPESDNQQLYELKFYHRIGVKTSPVLIKQYESIFALDNANLWAYHQLLEHYAFQAKNWPLAYEIAKKANIVHPDDEKILLDIARYYVNNARYDQAREFALAALDKNDSFDLAHEVLALIAARTNDEEGQLNHLRMAARLSPGSAVNNFNLGLQLLNLKREDEGFQFIQEALRIYPGYADQQEFREMLQSLKNEGKLPELLSEFLEPAMK